MFFSTSAAGGTWHIASNPFASKNLVTDAQFDTFGRTKRIQKRKKAEEKQKESSERVKDTNGDVGLLYN
jgi:hypothetical protein